MKFNKNVVKEVKEPETDKPTMETEESKEEKPKGSIQEMINCQIGKEMYSISVYEHLAAWADKKDYVNMAMWLMKKASEELGHKHKFIKYMFDRGWEVNIEAVDKPDLGDMEDVESLLNKALEHEKSVTESISLIQQEAEDKNDRLTYNFLDWFLVEQVEEEAVLMDRISNWKLSSDKYMFDQSFK